MSYEWSAAALPATARSAIAGDVLGGGNAPQHLTARTVRRCASHCSGTFARVCEVQRFRLTRHSCEHVGLRVPTPMIPCHCRSDEVAERKKRATTVWQPLFDLQIYLGTSYFVRRRRANTAPIARKPPHMASVAGSGTDWQTSLGLGSRQTNRPYCRRELTCNDRTALQYQIHAHGSCRNRYIAGNATASRPKLLCSDSRSRMTDVEACVVRGYSTLPNSAPQRVADPSPNRYAFAAD